MKVVAVTGEFDPRKIVDISSSLYKLFNLIAVFFAKIIKIFVLENIVFCPCCFNHLSIIILVAVIGNI